MRYLGFSRFANATRAMIGVRAIRKLELLKTTESSIRNCSWGPPQLTFSSVGPLVWSMAEPSLLGKYRKACSFSVD